MSYYAKIYRDELRELDHPLNRLQLRFFIAGCVCMERHPKITNFILSLMGLSLLLEVFFFAPID